MNIPQTNPDFTSEFSNDIENKNHSNIVYKTIFLYYHLNVLVKIHLYTNHKRTHYNIHYLQKKKFPFYDWMYILVVPLTFDVIWVVVLN